jgi:transcriptional regulator with XRE-family HTH domain
MVKHRLTYGEVSDKAGVRCETIARWKSRRSPDYFLLETVLNALGMTMIAVSFNLAELEDDALQ